LTHNYEETEFPSEETKHVGAPDKHEEIGIRSI